MEKFYREVFFPYIDDNDIKTIIDLGDTFDPKEEYAITDGDNHFHVWFNSEGVCTGGSRYGANDVENIAGGLGFSIQDPDAEDHDGGES